MPVQAGVALYVGFHHAGHEQRNYPADPGHARSAVHHCHHRRVMHTAATCNERWQQEQHHASRQSEGHYQKDSRADFQPRALYGLPATVDLVSGGNMDIHSTSC